MVYRFIIGILALLLIGCSPQGVLPAGETREIPRAIKRDFASDTTGRLLNEYAGLSPRLAYKNSSSIWMRSNLILLNNGGFFYTLSSCTTRCIITGRYSIKNDVLLLNGVNRIWRTLRKEDSLRFLEDGYTTKIDRLRYRINSKSLQFLGE